MLAEPVDVGEEEVARARRGGGEDPDLGEDDLRGGLEVRLAVAWKGGRESEAKRADDGQEGSAGI